MRKKPEKCVQLIAIATILSLMAFTISCQSLNPLPSLPSIASPAPPATTAGAISKDIENSLWNYSWLAIILSFCFPSLRAPLVFFLKSVFGILSLPLDLAHKHITMLYNNKYKNNG